MDREREERRQHPPKQHTNESITGLSRRPGDWSWKGVWEERVKSGIDASLVEPILYGYSGNGDDLIHFQSLATSTLNTVKEGIHGYAKAGDS
ncbi:MAG: hypothetical protein M1833_000384 [Piccolia ochrophora]|nr:MAG: hypothetical protein M1833_000384 [Piccolia ochrophora]